MAKKERIKIIKLAGGATRRSSSAFGGDLTPGQVVDRFVGRQDITAIPNLIDEWEEAGKKKSEPEPVEPEEKPKRKPKAGE